MIGLWTYGLAAAEEAAEAAESGFGLNFDVLDTNLINLAIVIAILVYFGRQLLGNILGDRRTRIETELTEAESRARQAKATLDDVQQKLASAQAEMARIRQEGQENARKVKERLLADSAREVERLREGAVQDLEAEVTRAKAEIERRIAQLALERVAAELETRLDDAQQQEQLNDRALARLEGGGR